MIFKNLIQTYKDSFKGLSTESWMLALVILLNRTGAMVIPFLTVYLTKNLNFTKVEAGFVLSIFGVGSLFGSLIGGMLTDKIGSFKVQFLSLLLTAPIFALIPHFTSVVGVSCVIFTLSIIAETFRPANSTAVSSYAKPENLTRAFSLNRMAINLGFSFGPALGGFLATFSYLWLFYGNGAAAILTAMVFYFYFKNRKVRNKLVKNEVAVDSSIAQKSPYKDRYFLLFSMVCILFCIVFSQLLSILPLYYKEIGQMSATQTGIILGYSGFFIVLLEMILVHWAEKHWSIYRTIIIGSLFGGLTYFILLFSQHVIVLYLSITFLCIAEILVLPFIATITAMRAGEKYKGAYMGVNGLSFSIALIFTPIVATSIAENFGYPTLWVVNSMISALAMIGFHWISKKMPM